jgi:hypothetical protein
MFVSWCSNASQILYRHGLTLASGTKDRRLHTLQLERRMVETFFAGQLFSALSKKALANQSHLRVDTN